MPPQPRPAQPRKHFDEAQLHELAASVERHGLLQPITVMRDPRDKGGFVVVAGERRFRAFGHLERDTIPAVVTSGNADEIALIENLQRENLSPVEEAGALQRLQKKYAYTHEELSRAVGKARSTVTNLLKLNALPRKIKRECSTSNIATRSFLIELSKLDDPERQLALWQEAKARGVTVREARRRKQAAAPAPPRPSVSPDTLASGQRFVRELERLGDEARPLDGERYEALLDIFKRFVAFMEREAERQAGQG